MSCLSLHQAVDVVGQAGTPKTITGFQTHTTPVLLAYGERAELATEECILFMLNAIVPTANSRIIVNREMRHKNKTLRWSYLLPVYRRAIDRSCNLARALH